MYGFVANNLLYDLRCGSSAQPKNCALYVNEGGLGPEGGGGGGGGGSLQNKIYMIITVKGYG